MEASLIFQHRKTCSAHTIKKAPALSLSAPVKSPEAGKWILPLVYGEKLVVPSIETREAMCMMVPKLPHPDFIRNMRRAPKAS